MAPTGGPPSERELSFRSFTDLDMSFAEALYASNRTAEFAASRWPPEVLRTFLLDQCRLRQIQHRQRYPTGKWLVIELVGQAIGHLYLDETPGHIHIIDFALAPAERCHGCGTQILANVIANAHCKGKSVSAHVERTNRALGLYLRLGFEEIEDHGFYLLMECKAASLS